jgi:VanZ family protein
VTAKVDSRSAFLVVAVALTVGLAFVAAHPRFSQLFAHRLHRSAHFGAFAVFAYAWARGLPNVHAVAVALVAVSLGFAHEAYEIVGHGHAYEIADACYDAAGAFAGVFLARRGGREHPASPPES